MSKRISFLLTFFLEEHMPIIQRCIAAHKPILDLPRLFTITHPWWMPFHFLLTLHPYRRSISPRWKQGAKRVI